jgi:hypothetical protein
MSTRVVAWVLESVRLPGDPIAKLVLLGLAEHANPDGTAAWPTQAKLAEYADVSTRTVIRKLQELQELGFIQPGDQELVSHYRADRRPRVWDVLMARGDSLTPRERGDTVASPRSEERGDTVLSRREEPRGDTGDQNGVTLLSHIPSFKPSLKKEPSLRSGSTRAPARARPTTKGTRLDPGWIPDPELRQQMALECPHVDLRAEHAVFVDFWIAKPGQGGTKLDWPATWRNWMRRAERDAPRVNGRSRPRHQQETQDYLARAMQDAIELDEATARKELT